MNALALLLSVCLAAPPALHCADGDHDRCAYPLEEGQKAPFSGQLLTPKLALRLAQVTASCDTRIEMARRQAAEDARIDLNKAIDLRALDRQRFDDIVGQCRSALADARQEIDAKTPWYASAWLWVPIAVVGTGVGIGFLLKAASPAPRQG